jgi:hypothetical protein
MSMKWELSSRLEATDFPLVARPLEVIQWHLPGITATDGACPTEDDKIRDFSSLSGCLWPAGLVIGAGRGCISRAGMTEAQEWK